MRLFLSTASKLDFFKKKTSARASFKPLLFLLFFGLAACNSGPEQTAIPKDLSQPAPQFDQAVSTLSEENRALISRYILRKKLSAAYEKNASAKRENIASALVEQRAYEKMHPNDPTGKLAYLEGLHGIAPAQKGSLIVGLLRAVGSSAGDPNKVQLQLVLTSGFAKEITRIEGSVRLQATDAADDKVLLPIEKNFAEPIAAFDARKVIIETDIAPSVIMKAIKSTSLINAALDSGKLYFADGSNLEIG